jgi:tRNA U34 2-thiouridine synthase MnmA/TrmU
VVDKDIDNNILVVAQGQDHPRLYQNTLETGHIHWINGANSAVTGRTANIRYRHQTSDAPWRIPRPAGISIISNSRSVQLHPASRSCFTGTRSALAVVS